MKKHILLIGVFICLSIAGNAQNPIAKIKYEEAEQAYSLKDYTAAIEKLDEAEQLLGSSNPKTQYLRIMIYDKQLESQVFKDLEMAAKLTFSCTDFLAKNASVQALEDKYLEVYKVSEKIKPYNLTAKDFTDAKTGSTAAMLKLARAYGYFEDYANEFKWYKQLADKGNGSGLRYLSEVYAWPKFRQPVKKDNALSAQLDTKASSTITPEERTFYNGYRNIRSISLYELEESAKAGNAEGAVKLSDNYLATNDFSKGMEWAKNALKLGNPEGMYQLFDIYDRGSGVDKNPQVAKEYLQKGVALGSTKCMMELADAIKDENPKEALALYLKAADKGNERAITQLAYAYQYGNLGVQQNYTKALEWYTKATTVSPIGTAVTLAQVYQKGECGPKDYAKAIEWFAIAYQDGWSDWAKEQIVKLYREGGYGIEKSEAKAQEWETKKR